VRGEADADWERHADRASVVLALAREARASGRPEARGPGIGNERVNVPFEPLSFESLHGPCGQPA